MRLPILPNEGNKMNELTEVLRRSRVSVPHYFRSRFLAGWVSAARAACAGSHRARRTRLRFRKAGHLRLYNLLPTIRPGLSLAGDLIKPCRPK
jgi:hypothetical protein